jgi:hypothetical protein
VPGRKSEEVALTTFGAVIQSYVDQGVLPRNVIALVERPKDADGDDTHARGGPAQALVGADGIEPPTAGV